MAWQDLWIVTVMSAGAAEEVVTLTPAGAAIMSVSVASVLALVGFCLYRVLTLPPITDEHLVGPLKIDTGDTIDAD